MDSRSKAIHASAFAVVNMKTKSNLVFGVVVDLFHAMEGRVIDCVNAFAHFAPHDGDLCPLSSPVRECF